MIDLKRDLIVVVVQELLLAMEHRLTIRREGLAASVGNITTGRPSGNRTYNTVARQRASLDLLALSWPLIRHGFFTSSGTGDPIRFNWCNLSLSIRAPIRPILLVNPRVCRMQDVIKLASIIDTHMMTRELIAEKAHRFDLNAFDSVEKRFNVIQSGLHLLTKASCR